MIKLKKLIITFLFSFLLFSTISETAYAQEVEVLDTTAGWVELIDKVEKFADVKGENISQFIAKQIYGGLETMLMETCPSCTRGGERVMNDPTIPDSAKMGLLETSEKAVYSLFNSVPTVDVPAHLAQQWVPGYADSNSTYAAGYTDLRNSKVDVLWMTTRNIAYTGFVVIMIAIGFMIMFRHKIGGQIMVTVGNSIPKVVVALVLVTFSFAIIGLIIDIGALIMKLVQILLYGGPEMGEGVKITNPITMFGNFFSKTGFTFKLFSGTNSLVTVILTIAGVFKSGTATTVGIIGLLLTLIPIGIVFWGMVKLWITLLKAYLGIIMNVIFAPLAIFAGALPGNEASTINIFKSALRNVLVFPIAYAIVNLPYYAESKGITLAFPTSLAGEEAVDGKVGGFMLAVVKIVAIYAAANAPAMAAVIVPPTVSKQVGDTATAVKTSLSGIPLIGSMFK